jgi:hypothetical protein
MKLELKPILTCTTAEYETNIKPLISYLEEFYACPLDTKKKNTSWNCDAFGNTCNNCPFYQTNILVQKAIETLTNIKIDKEN